MAATKTADNPFTGLGALEHVIKQRHKKTKGQIVEVKGELDKLNAFLEQYREATNEQLIGLRDGFKSRLDALEQRLANSPLSANSERKDAAAQLWEAKGFAEMLKGRGDMPARGGFAVPSLTRRDLEKKETVISLGTELGDLVDPYISPRWVLQPLDRVRVIDLLTTVSVPGADTYTFKRETETSGHGYLYTTLAADVVSGAGATATLTNIEGVLVGQTHRFHTAGGIETAIVDSFVPATRVVTYTATLNFDALTGDAVTGHEYGSTAESAIKPYTYFAAENVTVALQTIATCLGITNQSLNTISALRTFLEGRMRSRARINKNSHALYGTGADGWLNGFFQDTNIAQQLWSTMDGGSNMVDVVLLACATILRNGYGLPVVAMNPLDWDAITRIKDDVGQYLHYRDTAITITNTSASQAIGPYPVVPDERVMLGDFLAADFAEVSEFADQGTSAFATGYINDQFIRNELTARYEDTVAHAIRAPGAAIRGQWDAAP